MDCATFENGLTRLLERTVEGAKRRRLLDELGSHAARCNSCRGSDDLLRLLALPPEERDLAADPGPEYWARFNERLRDRIDSGERAPAARSRRVGLIAAAILLAVAAGWMLFDRGDGRGPASDRAVLAEAAEDPLPDPLARSLAEATPAEVAAQLDALSDWNTDWEDTDDLVWGGADPFPDTSDLDAEARQELLSWLREQSS